MAVPVQAPKFEKHFWGKGNKGFDVLYHNFKAGVSASRELNEFLKERISVEDGYVRGLAKLSKNVAAVPSTSLGSLSPLWQAVHAMCENLTAAHAQFIQLLHDLSREVSEYHIAQKDKLKANLKGEIDDAGDSLRLLETQEASLQRAKKLYTQSVEQYVKQQKKMDKAKGDANLKNKAQVEGRLKQAENWMETMKVDYKMTVEAHTRQFMGFQANMLEACQKYGSLEEEHLAQMITFVMKMSEAQENVHILIGKAHQRLHSQMESNSVEKMLCEFVEARGTGRDKPTPEKFRPVTDRALASLIGSSFDEQRNRAPSVDSQHQRAAKPEKSIRQRIRFKKKVKPGTEPSSGDQTTTNHTISDPQEAIPVGEVDEEGYSIRPQDAAAIRGFPDENPEQDSDDSDFEDDFQSRVRQVQIKDPPQDLPKATVDDIRASVQTLRLGVGGGSNSPSNRIRKATSSQSLNTVLHTPPLERKSQQDTRANSSLDPVMSSLLDSDISLSPGAGMGPVLQPLPPAGFSSDPMEPLRPLAWTKEPAPPLLPSPLSSHTSSLAASPSSLTDPERPVPKPRSVTKPNQKRLSGDNTLSESPLTKDLTSQLAGEGNLQITVSTTSGWVSSSDEEGVISTRTPALSVKDSPSARSDTSNTSFSSDAQPPGATAATWSPPFPPNPRKTTRQRGTTPEGTTPLSPLVQSHTPLGGSGPTPTSPSHSVVNPAPSTTPTNTTTTAGSKNPTGVPLAIAFQETCNAIFKSTNASDCLVKVTGEMVVSFPASVVGQVERYSQLSFRLRDTDKMKQVLHNQILLTREGGSYSYSFNTSALGSHLTTMAGKKTAPFYNMQLIKYEVDITDGSLLPVRLAAYWKCTELVTNFRFDYSYIGTNLPPSPGPHPTLTQMTVCVPVNGGVRNTLSRPSGNWLTDKQQITWKIGDVPPGPSDAVTSIHAKFDVTQGPSLPQPAEVKFVCDGSTLSGVDLDLSGSDYRISLLKRKFSSGKYVAEMRY